MFLKEESSINKSHLGIAPDDFNIQFNKKHLNSIKKENQNEEVHTLFYSTRISSHYMLTVRPKQRM